MIVGTVKEILENEHRVGLTPDSVREYLLRGHQVLVETNAGLESGYDDQSYIDAGALIKYHASDVWQEAEMIVKVKEPKEKEFQFFKEGLIIYTYLHLAADENLTRALLKSGAVSIAYETIELDNGTLPCLKPMSEIAGRLSIIEGAKYLGKATGGKGILISGLPGVKGARVAIIGAGNVGENALRMAVGLNAQVTILDRDLEKLTRLDHLYQNQITTLYSSSENILKVLKESDLIISSVLIKGAKAPKLIRNSHYQLMQKGTVIVDVAIDQGGSTESSRRTTHENPIYEVEGIIHYCVGNMPGSVPQTATIALNQATLEYGLEIASKGVLVLNNLSLSLLKGINTYFGKCTYQGVADAFSIEFTSII